MLGIIQINNKTIGTITDGYRYLIPIEILYDDNSGTYCADWDNGIITYSRCREPYEIFTDEWYTEKGYYRIPVLHNYSPIQFYAIKTRIPILATITDEGILEHNIKKIPKEKTFIPPISTKIGIVAYNAALGKIEPFSTGTNIDRLIINKINRYYSRAYNVNVTMLPSKVKIEFGKNFVNMKDYSKKHISGYIFTPNGLKRIPENATILDIIKTEPDVTFSKTSDEFSIVYNEITSKCIFTFKNIIAIGEKERLIVKEGDKIVYKKKGKITPVDFAYLVDGIIEDYGVFLV